MAGSLRGCDPAKDKLNVSNHCLSLKFAEQLVWDEAFVWVDPRYQYDELRRIISLRLAERREVKKYVENNT